MGKCVRVKWIDYAKGITMLLVIIGHTISDDLIRGMIFSFHMPLFFMLSCVTYRFSLDKGELKAKTRKSFMHLIIPVISIFLICLVYRFLTDMKEWESLAFVPAFLKEQFKTIVFCSGSRNSPKSFPVSVPALGIPWFCVVLFCSRTLLDTLHLYLDEIKLMLVSCVLSVAGVFIGKFVWLPFSFDVVLAVIPFLYIALYFRKINVSEKPLFKFVVAFVIWIVIFFVIFYMKDDYLQLDPRKYPMYPLCYIGAFFGTWMLSELSVLLCNLSISRSIVYLGKYSMYMLIVHSLDSTLFVKLWIVNKSEYVNCIMRLLVDTILFLLLKKCIDFWKITKLKSANITQ